MSDHPDAELAGDAIKMAAAARGGNRRDGHLDRVARQLGVGMIRHRRRQPGAHPGPAPRPFCGI